MVLQRDAGEADAPRMIPLEPVAWTEPIPNDTPEQRQSFEIARARLGVAAIELANERDQAIRLVSFDDVCIRAAVPRSSGYRHVRGMGQLLDEFIHPWTERLLVASIHSSIGLVTHSRNTPWTSESLLTAGACGLLTGLSLAPYTSRYLMHRPDLAAEYLTATGEQGPAFHLATQLGSCALRSEVHLDHTQLVELIRSVLAAATEHTMEEGVWPSGTPRWPAWLEDELRRRGAAVGVDDVERDPLPTESHLDDGRRDVARGLLARNCSNTSHRNIS